MRITSGGTTTFSLSDLCEWSGATAPQVEYWCQSWMRPLKASPGKGFHRVFSLQNVIEAAMARTLTEKCLSGKQLKALFAQLHTRLDAVPPDLRASATFVRYVEVQRALVTITEPGPNYAQWEQDCAAVLRSWKKKQTPLNDQILQILAGARAAERAAREETDGR